MADYMPDTIVPDGAIVVEQLPVIRERLQIISDQIKERVSEALALECTEDTVRVVKAARAALNKDFGVLEAKRMEAKAAIMSPYNQFEAIYKTLIMDVFNEGINTLATRINAVQDELRKQKEQSVKDYYEEYKQCRVLQSNYDMEFVSFEKAGLNINLSSSLKSLKEQVKAFIDRVCSDLEAIETSPNHAEILCEYKRTLDLGLSISTVERRRKEIEEQKERAEKTKQERAARKKAQQEREKFLASEEPSARTDEHEHDRAQSSVLPPPVITAVQETPVSIVFTTNVPDIDPVKTLTFSVTAPLSKLRALKKFLVEGGYTING